jgi:predicted N-acetyltransferase YhbS
MLCHLNYRICIGGKRLMEDKTLVCQDCGKEFVFTVGEQEFYKEKGFENEPKRCKECRDKRKAERRARRENTAPAEEA